MRTATGLAALLLASATAFAPGRGGRATRSPAFRASRAAPSFSARDGASPADGASGASDDLHASLRERWCELMLEKMVIAHSLPELELGLVDSSADELDGAFGGSWRAAASRCRRRAFRTAHWSTQNPQVHDWSTLGPPRQAPENH